MRRLFCGGRGGRSGRAAPVRQSAAYLGQRQSAEKGETQPSCRWPLGEPQLACEAREKLRSTRRRLRTSCPHHRPRLSTFDTGIPSATALLAVPLPLSRCPRRLFCTRVVQDPHHSLQHTSFEGHNFLSTLPPQTRPHTTASMKGQRTQLKPPDTPD